MLDQLVRNWWTLVLRGIFAIAFGVIAFALPAAALFALVLVYGAYALLDGIFAFYSMLTGRASGRRGWILLEGITGIIAGIVTFAWPAITAIALVYIIAAWAIITGFLEIMAAVELRRLIKNEWLLVVSGILSVVFGVLIAANPGAGALSIVWLIGLYAVIFGVLLVSLGFRLRGLAKKLPSEEAVSESQKAPGVPTEAGKMNK